MKLNLNRFKNSITHKLRNKFYKGTNNTEILDITFEEIVEEFKDIIKNDMTKVPNNGTGYHESIPGIPFISEQNARLIRAVYDEFISEVEDSGLTQIFTNFSITKSNLEQLLNIPNVSIAPGQFGNIGQNRLCSDELIINLLKATSQLDYGRDLVHVRKKLESSSGTNVKSNNPDEYLTILKDGINSVLDHSYLIMKSLFTNTTRRSPKSHKDSIYMDRNGNYIPMDRTLNTEDLNLLSSIYNMPVEVIKKEFESFLKFKLRMVTFQSEINQIARLQSQASITATQKTHVCLRKHRNGDFELLADEGYIYSVGHDGKSFDTNTPEILSFASVIPLSYDEYGESSINEIAVRYNRELIWDDGKTLKYYDLQGNEIKDSTKEDSLHILFNKLGPEYKVGIDSGCHTVTERGVIAATAGQFVFMQSRGFLDSGIAYYSSFDYCYFDGYCVYSNQTIDNISEDLLISYKKELAEKGIPIIESDGSSILENSGDDTINLFKDYRFAASIRNEIVKANNDLGDNKYREDFIGDLDDCYLGRSRTIYKGMIFEHNEMSRLITKILVTEYNKAIFNDKSKQVEYSAPYLSIMDKGYLMLEHPKGLEIMNRFNNRFKSVIGYDLFNPEYILEYYIKRLLNFRMSLYGIDQYWTPFIKRLNIKIDCWKKEGIYVNIDNKTIKISRDAISTGVSITDPNLSFDINKVISNMHQASPYLNDLEKNPNIKFQDLGLMDVSICDWTEEDLMLMINPDYRFYRVDDEDVSEHMLSKITVKSPIAYNIYVELYSGFDVYKSRVLKFKKMQLSKFNKYIKELPRYKSVYNKLEQKVEKLIVDIKEIEDDFESYLINHINQDLSTINSKKRFTDLEEFSQFMESIGFKDNSSHNKLKTYYNGSLNKLFKDFSHLPLKGDINLKVAFPYRHLPLLKSIVKDQKLVNDKPVKGKYNSIISDTDEEKLALKYLNFDSQEDTYHQYGVSCMSEKGKQKVIDLLTEDYSNLEEDDI